MLSYWVKCSKMKKVKIRKLLGQKTNECGFYQNVECVIVKNQNLSKSKNLVYKYKDTFK